MRAFLDLVGRDLRLALRQIADVTLALAFFLIAAALFPLGVGPEPQTLARIAPGVVWVLALLAVLLSLDRLFQQDYEDGSLDLLLLAPAPIWLLVLAKVLAHWITTGLPVLILAPVIAVMLNMPPEGMVALLASLAIGTPVMNLIGAVGAALILGARRAGVLLAVLVLPLYVPVLVFGVSAVDAAVFGFPMRPHLLILGAMLAGALPLAAWAASAALRQASH